MSETIREKLNRIDHKCLDENLRFHDLRSLFEATAPRLSPQDKEEIKKVIQNTDDAETIAAVLQAKAMDDKNESLEEKLIPAPQEVVDKLINILNKYGFVLDDSFKVNPGKTFMGDTHMQVINPESLVDMSDEINIQDELSKYVTQDLIDEIHDLDQKSDCPITWNFGPNKNGQVTGGLDIMKQWVEESYKDVYYVIVDKHGNQLSRPTKDDSELWDRVESRDPKGTRGLKVIVYTGKVDEKLNEASYGGAYDIEDDMFFTKEELMEFGYDLAEQFSAWAEGSCELSDLYMTSPTDLVIEVSDEDGAEHQAKVKIDMRKIKLLKDIYKYSDIILKQWKDSYNEYHQADEEFFNESLNEDYIWEITYGKGRPGGNIEHVKFPEYKDAFEYAANNDHGWGFDIKNLSLEKSNKSLKESEDSYFDYDGAVKYIESKGISADPTTYVGEYVCDMLDDFASDDETYSKEDLDSIINDVQQLIGETDTDSEAPFNIIIDGQKLEDITAEDIKWAKEDIENANIDVNDVYEYHVNEDADYFIITFKDGTKKAWYIHSGMYIPDEDFIDESLEEDTVKQNGKWVNKGKEGTHGKFNTKKAADAQRRAMFVNGYKGESLVEKVIDLGNNKSIYSKSGKYYINSNGQTKEISKNQYRTLLNGKTLDKDLEKYKELSKEQAAVDKSIIDKGFQKNIYRKKAYNDRSKKLSRLAKSINSEGDFEVLNGEVTTSFINNESLNEAYSVGYVKGHPYNQDMIYSVSVNPAQKNRKGERYSIVTLHLVCGKDYVDSTAYDGQAWVDAKQFVDDVQLEQIVWYPDDESLADALEANDYIECNRPHFIWHYDEEKDDWYRDRNFHEDWNIEDQIDAPDTIGKLNPGDKFKNRNGVEITIIEPQKDGTIQYKIGDEVRAGSERSIQRMLYKNNYLREDYNSFLTLADKDANRLRNEYDKGDKSIFDILTSLNYIQDDPDSVYMYKEVSDGYAIVFDLSSLDEGKNYVKYFVVDENNNIPKGYTITKLLIEDYQHDKDEWGEPYSYDEVERELKSITNNWTDKEGTIRCYWEQEKNYGLQILKKHYKYIETSDGRTGKGEDMSWILAYSEPKELEESLNEARTSNLQDAIIDCLDWFILMEMDFPKDKFLADSWEDVKDGVIMGVDPEFEIAEGIVEYLKPIITFNKRYNKEVEEEGIFRDEIEMYKKLIKEMNNYLVSNGYKATIKE